MPLWKRFEQELKKKNSCVIYIKMNIPFIQRGKYKDTKGRREKPMPVKCIILDITHYF